MLNPSRITAGERTCPFAGTQRASKRDIEAYLFSEPGRISKSLFSLTYTQNNVLYPLLAIKYLKKFLSVRKGGLITPRSGQCRTWLYPFQIKNTVKQHCKKSINKIPK